MFRLFKYCNYRLPIKSVAPNVNIVRILTASRPNQQLVKPADDNVINNGTPTIDLTNLKSRVIIRQGQETCSQWKQTPSNFDLQYYFQYYLKLSKFKLTVLVVISTLAGYAIAPAPVDPQTLLLLMIGSTLLSGSANTINQYHEVPFDAQMARTRNRVLVCGKLTPVHAVTFAALSGIVGLTILYTGVDHLTAMLGLTNLIIYTSIYTPLKRISILNTWVGSIVGAIPPLGGYAACTHGILDPSAWLMASILFCWQFPHFNALSWNLRPEYSRAGYRMMAVTNPALCRRVALRHSIAIAGLSFLAPYVDATNQYFIYESLPLNVYFIFLAYRFYRNSDSKSSKDLFKYSLVHLPLIIVLFLLNKKYWYNRTDKKNVQKLAS